MSRAGWFVVLLVTAMGIGGMLQCQRVEQETLRACIQAGRAPLECEAAMGTRR